mgnify:CR=1 FL=1
MALDKISNGLNVLNVEAGDRFAEEKTQPLQLANCRARRRHDLDQLRRDVIDDLILPASINHLNRPTTHTC